MPLKYDFVIVGGGIFGCYAALFLAKKAQKVLLVEKEGQLLRKASVVNQARLHSGYHYPRSIATAKMSNENKKRFTSDHRPFINTVFDKYYGIDKFASFTDQYQYQRFCDFLELKCKHVSWHPWIDSRRLEALFLTEELSFDPILIANFYRQQVKEHSNIKVSLQTSVSCAHNDGDKWVIQIKPAYKEEYTVETTQVINATYAGSNAVNQLFGVKELDLMHEISEMAFISSPQLKNTGLTIMDGPFGSLMPYGLSGLLSLSSVAYTHHKVSYENSPVFDCQDRHPTCRPTFLGNCNECDLQPRSNWRKMIGQIRQYLKPEVQLNYCQSMFAVKSKLKANYIDDGRPTEISILHENPRFYCIFAGKINSIYEIEKVIIL